MLNFCLLSLQVTWRLTIERVLTVLGWVLVAMAALFFVGSIYSAFWVQQAGAERLSKALSLTSVVPVGVLLTLGGILLAKAREVADTEEKRSRFYLDSCVVAYEEARILLADENSDRATWIAAARALRHAQMLSNRVSVDAHLRVLELHQLKYRRFFHDNLQARPAAFFYGVHDASASIDAAAAASTAPEESVGATVSSTVKALSEESLHAVWEAAQFPTGYRDPLDIGFSQEEQGRLLVPYPGLHEYLEHSQQQASGSGRLFRRDQNERH